MRDSFRKHHKKETTFKSGSEGKGHKKWYLYDNLLFLLPFVADLNTSTSSNLVEELHECQQWSQQESPKEFQETSFRRNTILHDNLPATSAGRPIAATSLEDSLPGPKCPLNKNTPATRIPQRKRPYPQERQYAASPFDAEMLNTLKVMQQQQKETRDEDEHFLLSFVPVMKSLDSISKFEFRGELNATALRYLRRTQQTTQLPDQGHSSRTSIPSSVCTEHPQYQQYMTNASHEVHQPQVNSAQYSQHQVFSPDIMFK